ncbi:hypothetical protein T439DRAFT_182390 [Meredithblackwellia eburnea MCA 4105]
MQAFCTFRKREAYDRALGCSKSGLGVSAATLVMIPFTSHRWAQNQLDPDLDKTIQVTNIPPNTPITQVTTFFSLFGRLDSVAQNSSTKDWYVRFESAESAKAARQHNGQPGLASPSVGISLLNPNQVPLEERDQQPSSNVAPPSCLPNQPKSLRVDGHFEAPAPSLGSVSHNSNPAVSSPVTTGVSATSASHVPPSSSFNSKVGSWRNWPANNSTLSHSQGSQALPASTLATAGPASSTFSTLQPSPSLMVAIPFPSSSSPASSITRSTPHGVVPTTKNLVPPVPGPILPPRTEKLLSSDLTSETALSAPAVLPTSPKESQVVAHAPSPPPRATTEPDAVHPTPLSGIGLSQIVELPTACVGNSLEAVAAREKFRTAESKKAFRAGKIVLATEFTTSTLVIHYVMDEDEEMEDLDVKPSHTDAQVEPPPPAQAPPEHEQILVMEDIKPHLDVGDGEDVDMDISESTGTSPTGPPPVYFPLGLSITRADHIKTKEIVETFFQDYFRRFDSGRASLIDFYDPEAELSARLIQTIPETLVSAPPPPFTAAFKAMSQPVRHRTQTAIVNFITKLPAGSHDLSKLIWDASIMKTRGSNKPRILVVAHGQFEEFPSHVVRSVDRSFILTPSDRPRPHPYRILVDTLVFRHFDKEAPAPMTVGVNPPIGSISTAAEREVVVTIKEELDVDSVNVGMTREETHAHPRSTLPGPSEDEERVPVTGSTTSALSEMPPPQLPGVSVATFARIPTPSTSSSVSSQRITFTAPSLPLGSDSSSTLPVVQEGSQASRVRSPSLDSVIILSPSPPRVARQPEPFELPAPPPGRSTSADMIVGSAVEDGHSQPSAKALGKRRAVSPAGSPRAGPVQAARGEVVDIGSLLAGSTGDTIRAWIDKAVQQTALAVRGEERSGQQPISSHHPTAPPSARMPDPNRPQQDKARLTQKDGEDRKREELPVSPVAAQPQALEPLVLDDDDEPEEPSVNRYFAPKNTSTSDRPEDGAVRIGVQSHIIHHFTGSANKFRQLFKTGHTIAALSNQGTVVTWDTKSGNLQTKVAGSELVRVDTGAFSASSSALVVGCYPAPGQQVDGLKAQVQLHTFANDKYESTKNLVEKPHGGGGVTALTLTQAGPEKKRLRFATAGYPDKTIHLWTLRSKKGNEVTEVKSSEKSHTHTSLITALAYSNIQETLFSGSQDKRVIAYDIETARSLWARKEDLAVTDVQCIAQKSLLLVRRDGTKNQFALYDYRLPQNHRAVATFGFSALDNNDKAFKLRYTRGSFKTDDTNIFIHPDGMNGAKAWDLRFSDRVQTTKAVGRDTKIVHTLLGDKWIAYGSVKHLSIGSLLP